MPLMPYFTYQGPPSAPISAYITGPGEWMFLKSALLSAIGPLLALVMQPLWGVVSDRKGRHMTVLRLALVGSAAGVLCYYRADTFALFAVCVLIYSFFNCAVGPIGDSIVVDMAQETA